jgi:hypothetical protein
MKRFVLALALVVFGSVAQASEVKVFETPSTGMDDLYTFYTIDRNTGKVFVTLKVTSRTHMQDGVGEMTYFRTEVPSLRFDENASAIILDHEGQDIECATVTQRTVFRLNIIRDSGCRLVAKRTRRNFEVLIKIK